MRLFVTGVSPETRMMLPTPASPLRPTTPNGVSHFAASHVATVAAFGSSDGDVQISRSPTRTMMFSRGSFLARATSIWILIWPLSFVLRITVTWDGVDAEERE